MKTTKTKNLLLGIAIGIGTSFATVAQNVPNYVPTNGLVGWWPFNGNANDESGNNNNGTINGATLTSDRFGNVDKAYSFDGVTSFIGVAQSQILNIQNFNSTTITGWFNANNNGSLSCGFIIRYGSTGAGGGIGEQIAWGCLADQKLAFSNWNANNFPYFNQATNVLPINQWHFFSLIVDYVSNQVIIYIDGILFGQFNNQLYKATNPIINFGRNTNATSYFNGKIDDIGIWNRVLTQQEITDLYNAVNCANNTSITPQSNSLASGSAATFTASTTDPNPSYVWQSDFGQGFQTLNNFGNYSGVNTATLNIANVQLPNHTQPIRVISTSGNCIDTSNVAVINILDTCITNVTVYDTLLTTVTDTLVINATITGLNPPNNLNTIKVFPNPANDHITINYGNFASMNGFTLKITNNLGQVVFTTPINQQSSYIDLSTWSGNGIYFVQLIDPLNNTIENRKIVIQ